MSEPDATGIDPLSRWFGFRWEAADRLRLTITDDCMGSTLWKQRSEDERIATIGISINYVQTAREGDVICESTLDRRNDRVAVLHSEVRHEDGRLLATAIGSFAIFP